MMELSKPMESGSDLAPKEFVHPRAHVMRKRVAVVGLGASGKAAACLIARAQCAKAELGNKNIGQAMSLSLYDRKEKGELLSLSSHPLLSGARLFCGDAEWDFSDIDLIVISPGVPMSHELVKAEEQGIPIWSEVELASRFVSAPIIAVGGTNGKSTVTSLLGEVFCAAGFSCFVGGNLGEPLSNHVEEHFDFIVLEVSSFQMERVHTFSPKVSLLLNLSPDHLDRYPNMQAYADAKGNAFVHQDENSLAVFPHRDDKCKLQALRGKAKLCSFGQEGVVDVQRRCIFDSRDGERYEFEKIALEGHHNKMNVASVIAICRDLGVSSEILRNTFSHFRGLAHRMSFVEKIASVSFYNDSKGTNVGASVTALLGLAEKKVVLIAGGKDKMGGYEELACALLRKGRAVVLIGEAASKIEVNIRAISTTFPIFFAKSMQDAVFLAMQASKPGDAVLLSPACSSFDMFKSYVDRGEQFVKAVNLLRRDQFMQSNRENV